MSARRTHGMTYFMGLPQGRVLSVCQTVYHHFQRLVVFYLPPNSIPHRFRFAGWFRRNVALTSYRSLLVQSPRSDGCVGVLVVPFDDEG